MGPQLHGSGTIDVADIFISYSKADRDKIVMLAAYLESEGWRVWWDNSLAAGDTFRDEIMKQLAAARAVIVLWTQTSIKSDFVRAEAGRAKADGKLIPVKESDVAYGDIPLPFGEMHTEDLLKRELIRAAVVAQLAKPAVQPSLWWMATKTLRYQVLTWVGIVGGAITLFANLRGVLDLADWARWLVVHWHDWIAAFWKWTLAWVGVRLREEYAPLLSFTAFSIMTALGARNGPSKPNRSPLSLGSIWGNWALMLLIWLAWRTSTTTMGLIPHFIFGYVILGSLLVAFFFFLHRGKKLYVFVFLLIFIALYFLIFLPALSVIVPNIPELPLAPEAFEAYRREYVRRSFYMTALNFGTLLGALLLPYFMISLAPLERITVRLVFLATGLVALIALSQLSHYTPSIRTLLRPPT